MTREKLARVEEGNTIFFLGINHRPIAVYTSRAAADVRADEINTAADAWRDEAVRARIATEREMFLNAIRGKMSLCYDPTFFCEVNKIVKERVREAVEDFREKAAMVADSHVMKFNGLQIADAIRLLPASKGGGK